MWRRHRAFLLVACGIPLGVSVLGPGGSVFLLRTSGSWSVVGLTAAGAATSRAQATMVCPLRLPNTLYPHPADLHLRAGGQLGTPTAPPSRPRPRIAETRLTTGVATAREGSLDSALNHGEWALTGERQSRTSTTSPA
jgi:hypothetical protein